VATHTETDLLPARYTSVETLAHGGMGEIYTACDESLGREVAIKVLAARYAQDEALRARFTREALAAARLSGDAHTVTIYDVGEWNDRPYIVMELARGGTVAERLDDGRHDVADALRWLGQAAEALDAGHAHGIVHRDVKPANLLLTADDDVRVADFGIASAAGLTSVTATGTVLGTLGYLAPEQAAGTEVGPAADRYALAVVAYELLAGRRPFERDNGPAEAAAAAREPVPPISQVGHGLPRELDAVFERALAKDPAARYASCAELVGDIRRAFDDASGTTRVRARPARPPRERARWLGWVLAALLVGAGILAAVLLTRGGSNPPPPAPAKEITVTAQGKTVTVTTAAAVTTSAPPPATTTEAPAATTSSSLSGSRLNDAGWQKLQAGDTQGALPLFEQAVAKLQGTGSTAEAYADYNLALTRYSLGNCDGVLALLDRSEAIQGHRKEIDKLRREATKSGC
jgi:serine/threonine-protein kinase